MKIHAENNSRYLVLLVDRKRARMFVMSNGVMEGNEEVMHGYVPQKVKHGNNTWDSQNKIFRHIQDHLHLHLEHIGKSAASFAEKNRIERVIIGSHRPLFSKIQKHLPYPISERVRGTFVTELKVPIAEITKRANLLISSIEKEEVHAKIQSALNKKRIKE